MLQRQIELLQKSANRLGQWYMMVKERPKDQDVLRHFRKEVVQSLRLSIKMYWRVVVRKKV